MSFSKILFSSMLFLALVFNGCSSGEDSSNSEQDAISNVYSLVDSQNTALMGALRGANVKIFKYSDLNTSILENTTGEFGEFNVTLEGVVDDELLLVIVSGGIDIDTNDDSIIDSNLTENNGSLRGWFKAVDLKEGNAKVTLLSEIVYNYTEHLIGEIHVDDFEEALNSIASELFNSQEMNATYTDVKHFNPLDTSLKERMSFSYDRLLEDDSLADVIHKDKNSTILLSTLNRVLGDKLTLRATNLISNPKYYKVSLIPGIETNFSADNVNIFVSTETNESKTTAFVPVDSNVTFRAAPGSGVKIIDWDGCNQISDDLSECTITNIHETKTVMPRIQYKESIYSDNVKDLTGYFVIVDDNNYTITLDLNENLKRAYIEEIVTGDIIIKQDGTLRFFRKVISINKVDDYNYLLTTDDVSFLEIYKQGGMSLNRNLTYEDLAEEIETINRSLRTSGAVLLPPEHENDDTFTIVLLNPENDINRAIADTGDVDVTLYDDNNGNKIGIKGSVTFTIKANFDYNTKFLSLESMRMVTTMTLDSDITLYGQAAIIDAKYEESILKNADGSVRTLRFQIPSGWLMLEAKVGFFYGITGNVAAEINVGGKIHTVKRIGFNVYQGELNEINENTSESQIIGDVKATASVYGYLKATPGISALHIAGLDVNTSTGLDVSGSASIIDRQFIGKVDWKTILTPSFYIPYPLHNFGWAQDLEKEINNDIFAQGISFTFSKNIYTGVIGAKPAQLDVSAPVMNESVYSDAGSIEKSYNFVLTNKGEEALKWKIETSSLGEMLDIQITSGELVPNESIDIIANLNILISDDLVGETWEGYINIINETNDEGTLNKKMTLEIIPKLTPPSEINNVYLSGLSLIDLNFDLPSYSWDTYANYYDDRGFKIYVSKVNDGVCGDDYQLVHNIDVMNNYDEIFTFGWTKVNLKEKMDALSLDYGERYCFKLSTYLKGYSSESSAITSLYYIPNLATIKTSIKDRSGNPIPDAKVHLTSLSDNSSSDGDGNVIFENLIPGTYLITVEADGFINTPSEVTVDDGEVKIFEGIRVIEENLEGLTGTISGSAIDAISSLLIADVAIDVREGNSNVAGSIITSTVTDINGGYTLSLSTGNYTLSISKNGYITTYLNVLSIGNEITINDVSLSPILSTGELRAVLRWADTPSDLDSHLVKKTDGVENYHIYYSYKTSGNDSLDRDDVDGVGPETVTISSVNTASVYTYYVYNFSRDDLLKNSLATVEVSFGSYSQTFAVPNEDGVYWKVFEIVDEVIVPCTVGCVQNDTSTLIRSLDENSEEQALFLNLPSKN